MYRLNLSKPSSQESRGFNHGSVKDANPGLHDEILADMVIAAKEGMEYTAEDPSRRLEGIDLHGLTAARILSNL